MGKSAIALVNPQLLSWARKSIGYTQGGIAKKLGGNFENRISQINSWEEGKLSPTIVQLRKLADIYKRPLATFYLEDPPDEPKPIHDFRRISVYEEVGTTPKLNLEIRNAFYRRQVALEIFEELNESSPELNYKISLKDDPEVVGEKIRGILNIQFRNQVKWSDRYDALNAWKTVVENTGVLVFQSSGIDTSFMRGFSICEFPLPVIGLNAKDSPHGRIFTLMHEFAHILLKVSGVCDLYDYYERKPKEQEIEVFCNNVAGASLIPRHLLLSEDIVRDKNDIEGWTNKDLSDLSNRFRTSRETVLRRLLISERTTLSFYKKKREEFIEEYKRIKIKEREREQSFGIPVPTRVISSNGLPFTELVLNSYSQNKITDAKLSGYLGMKLNHLPKLIDDVRARAMKMRG